MHDEQLNYFLIVCVLTVAGVILPSYEVFAAPDMLACTSARAIADYLYRTSGVIFFHRLLHSYTRHIERVARGERDIVPSTQD